MFFAWIAALALLASCQPKTETQAIEEMKNRVEANAKMLDKLESDYFSGLEKDFISCDSMLQYLSEEEVDAVFEELQLAGAYITQFKSVSPTMKTNLEYSKSQLDKLQADAESHYLSDSLVNVYLADEARSLDTLNAQLEYFKDRFEKCQQTFDDFKKKK